MARVERNHLEAFVAVAEAGSIVAAAHRLHLSPSAISKSVSHLEHQVGAPLFERTAAGMTRLPLADRLMSSAQLVVVTMEGIEARTAADSSGVSEVDQIRVLSASSLVPNPLSDIAHRFLQTHPSRRLFLDTLREPELDLIIDRVLRGHYDLGITEAPRARIPGLVMHEIPEEEVWAVLPPGSGDTCNGDITTDQLVECGLVAGQHWESSDVYRRLVALDSRIHGAVRVRSMHRDAFLSFTLAGFGATLMMAASMQHLVEAGCTVGRVRGLPARRLCVLHRDQPRSEAVEVFAAICRENVPLDARVPPSPL